VAILVSCTHQIADGSVPAKFTVILAQARIQGHPENFAALASRHRIVTAGMTMLSGAGLPRT
jgi:hypothetical protein